MSSFVTPFFAALNCESFRLLDFLQPLMRMQQSTGPRIVRSPNSQPSSPRTTITASLLGQPPSVPDVSQPSDVNIPSSDDSITFAVKTIERACGDLVKNEDPADLILAEKLEEKEGMLMDGAWHLSHTRI